MKSKDVILDTNLWISFLIKRDLRSIDSLIEKGKIKLVFSEELLQEFLTVSRRPKFRKYFSDTDIEELLRVFDMYGKFVKVSTIVNDCRDNRDNFLLNLAIDSKADYLVTGDSDLLELSKVGVTEIITLKDFLKGLK
jgi:putative PIN family toxin of toxin-antitoxin system